MARSDQFAALVAQQPENELFRFSLAQALRAEDRVDEAVPHWEICTAKRQDWMMPRILLGKALLQLGRAAEAKPMLESALQLAVAQDHQEPATELRGLLDSMAR